MKVKSFKFLMVFILSVAGLYACASLQPFFSRPRLDFREVTITDMSMTEASLLFTFQVHNPNPVAIPLDRIEYALTAENKALVRGQVEPKTRLPAADSEYIQMPVMLNFMEAFDSGAELFRRDAVKYLLSTTFTIMGFSLPLETEGEIEVPKLPRVNLLSPEIERIDPTGATINFSLEIDNPNSFDIHPESIEYSIELGGVPFIRTENRDPGKMAADGSTRIVVPAKIDFVDAGRSAMTILNRRSVDYSLSGRLFFASQAGQREIEFSRSGSVPLGR